MLPSSWLKAGISSQRLLVLVTRSDQIAEWLVPHLWHYGWRLTRGDGRSMGERLGQMKGLSSLREESQDPSMVRRLFRCPTWRKLLADVSPAVLLPAILVVIGADRTILSKAHDVQLIAGQPQSSQVLLGLLGSRIP